MVKVDFVGIGAKKSGTTWIAKCLEEHPQIFVTKNKEIDFFNEKFPKHQKVKISNFSKGKKWYEKHFISAKENQKIVDSSPVYMWDTSSAKNIKNSYPEAKLFAILRDPIKRAHSHYLHVKQIFDIGTFEEALEKYPEIKESGLYGKQLNEYFEYFDKDDIHIMIFEEFKKNPKSEMKKLLNFIGVDDNFVPNGLELKFNVTKYPRFEFITKITKNVQKVKNYKLGYKIWNFWPVLKLTKVIYRFIEFINLKKGEKPIVDPKCKKILKEYYKEDVRKVEEIIGRKIDCWDKY